LPRLAACQATCKQLTILHLTIKLQVIHYITSTISTHPKKDFPVLHTLTQKALSGPKVTSRLVAECLGALSELAGLNEVTLVWVLGHRGIFGSEEADKLARQASAKPLLGPEPALGIPNCLTREAIKKLD
jgi:hypothetical protein